LVLAYNQSQSAGKIYQSGYMAEVVSSVIGFVVSHLLRGWQHVSNIESFYVFSIDKKILT
jgi:hypothetical protein